MQITDTETHALAWQRELARKRGSESPVRLVSSAKSWLSHSGVNRAAAILPWDAPAEVPSTKAAKAAAPAAAAPAAPKKK